MENLEKSLSGRLLFKDISLGIDSDEKIGFLAPNGTGKSTLLKLLSGELEPDSGRIHRNRELKISLLPQDVRYRQGETVRDYVYRHENSLLDLVRRYEESLDMKNPELYHELLEEMDRRNGWALESRITMILKRLGIADPSAPMDSLSGGMKRRASLARTLAGEANLLLLDEPTNHLDMETILWLQEYLVRWEGAMVVVTHDRYFLEAVCNRIWELESQGLYRYSGDYAGYLAGRADRLAAREKAQDRIVTVLRREEAWLRQGPKARAGRDKKRLRNLYSLRETLEAGGAEQAGFTVNQRRMGKKVLEVKNLSKTFDGRKIIDDFSFEFFPGQRIGLVGPNGAGKSTLLNLLEGSLDPDSGARDVGVNTHFGYFRQTFPKVREDLTVLESLQRIGSRYQNPDGSSLTPETLLDRFLFPRNLHRTPVGQISGGERRRFYLVSLLLEAPNFLILDEPTNDLDMLTLSLLEDFLDSFQGCLLLVSHDRAFLDRLADLLFVIPGDGSVQGYGGRCSDYLEWREEVRQEEKKREEKPQEPRRGGAASGMAAEKQGKPKNASRGLSFKEKKELRELEEEIPRLEEEQKALELFFSDPGTDPGILAEKNRRYQTVLSLLEERFLRWEELSERA